MSEQHPTPGHRSVARCPRPRSGPAPLEDLPRPSDPGGRARRRAAARRLTPAATAAVLAGLAVAGQRVGLALSLTLLVVVASAVVPARRQVDRPLVALAVLLALQPTLRDAGWVVAVTVVAALVATAGAVSVPRRWPALGRVVVAPARLLWGLATIEADARLAIPETPVRDWAAVGRGVAIAAGLVVVFGALFASADPAFANAGAGLLHVDADPWSLLWRVVLALLAVGVVGALAHAGAVPVVVGPAARPRMMPGRTELVIALGALVALFVAFVVVQLPVLFGGTDHVRRTGDLGYGEFAREGFVQLAVVATLTLAVVGIAARRRDRTVRLLLGVLCSLTLVVLLSAFLRLQLVVDAYGLTRVRYGGQAVVVWLAVVLGVVLLAGARQTVARHAPRAVLLLGVSGVLVFSLTNPDGRIGASIAARSGAGETVDRLYAQGLSADALHRLWTIPRARGAVLWGPIEARLRRPDGIAGFNVGRWTAR